ncbi:Gp37 family protein [Pyruvatibacter sp.]|uniref:Gp37 family protein n=1 Tax=Pyruvatibacter sp. TaxID=1981328 RepID=UPI0032EBDFCE
MSIATPRLALIAERLKMQAPSLLDVGLAADLAAAGDAVPRSPAAYVLPTGGTFSSDKVTGLIRQLETISFAVLIGFSNAGRDGARGIAEHEEVRDEVLDALMGFKPAGAQSAIQAKRQQLTAFDGKVQRLWWNITFTFDHMHRKETA